MHMEFLAYIISYLSNANITLPASVHIRPMKLCSVTLISTWMGDRLPNSNTGDSGYYVE